MIEMRNVYPCSLYYAKYCRILLPATFLSICALNSERKRKQEEEEKSEEYERLKKEREYR